MVALDAAHGSAAGQYLGLAVERALEQSALGALQVSHHVTRGATQCEEGGDAGQLRIGGSDQIDDPERTVGEAARPIEACELEAGGVAGFVGCRPDSRPQLALGLFVAADLPVPPGREIEAPPSAIPPTRPPAACPRPPVRHPPPPPRP